MKEFGFGVVFEIKNEMGRLNNLFQSKHEQIKIDLLKKSLIGDSLSIKAKKNPGYF